MLRIVEDRRPRRAFHHAAGVHHRDLVGHFGDDAKIVRDQDDRHAGLLLQVAQQVRICACTVTSSAVVGSSAISRSGAQASAIAIITRWRMPPDIWCGYSSKRRAGAGMRTRPSASIARGAQLGQAPRGRARASPR